LKLKGREILTPPKMGVFMSKKENILDSLPEVANNAQGYFTYATNPVIEESVNRGDARQGAGLVAGDITPDDIQELVKASLGLLDKRLLEHSRKEALADAVQMAINTHKDGKWQSKIIPSVADLILSQLDKSLTAKKEQKIEKTEDQNDKVADMAKSAGVMPGVQQVTDSGRVVNVPAAKARKMVSPRVMRQVDGPVLVIKNAMSILDTLAGRIQDLGLLKLAAEVDSVTNTLEDLNKTASDMSYLKERHPLLWELEGKFEAKTLPQLSGQAYQDFIAAAENFAADIKVRQLLHPEEKTKLEGFIARLKTNASGADSLVDAILSIVSRIKDAPV
jgi:hypothetical protein